MRIFKNIVKTTTTKQQTIKNELFSFKIKNKYY